MIDELQKQAKKKIGKRVLILSAILVVVLALFGSGFLNLILGPKDLHSLSADELEGAYVEADINVILDTFAEYTETEKSGRTTTTKLYYIVPVGDAEYFGVGMRQNDFSKANQVCDDTIDYIMGERSELTNYVHVKGTIKKMNNELREYYYEWFEETGLFDYSSQSELEQTALALVLEPYHIGLFEESFVYIAIAGCAALIVLIIINLVMGATGSSTAEIRKFIEKNGSTDSLEKVEADYQNAVIIESVKIGKHYTFYFQGSKARIVKNDDGLWAYLKRTTHRTNGIKTHTSYDLILYTRDKFLHTIGMAREESVNAALGQYSVNNPQIVLGYSDDLQKTFRKNFDAFVEMSRQQEEARTRAAAARAQQNQEGQYSQADQQSQYDNQSQQDQQGQYDQGGQAEAYEGPVARVILHNTGDKPIFVIKAVREILGCGLKEAKDIVDNVPSILIENIPLNDAQAIKAELDDLGATAEIEQAV